MISKILFFLSTFGSLIWIIIGLIMVCVICGTFCFAIVGICDWLKGRDNRLLDIENLIKSLAEKQKRDSNNIDWLQSKVEDQNENFKDIDKLIADLQKHTGYQVQKAVENVAQEFIGEKS